jgi:ribonuclease E
LIVIDFIDMEKTSNQREVESRLKDALHYDRARVQMGKISRFGLMELSRQRLRPALSEGSHTTCPRCNGTGVIRDTESSALHVLRIIQEESMKEGTASIRAQVPVDVATFLLNEKRSEIHKLEARLKVSIVLIPNKGLETPHYDLLRLRHDDERVDEEKLSFQLADHAVEEGYYDRKTVEEQKPPRQEAMIKGIVPTQPAPVVKRPVEAEPTPAAAPQPERLPLIDKILSWFKRPAEADASAPAAATPAAATETSRESRPNSRNGRDRNGRGRGEGRNGGRNGGRGERTERPTEALSANLTGTTPAETNGEAKPEQRSERNPRRSTQRQEGRNPEGRKNGRNGDANSQASAVDALTGDAATTNRSENSAEAKPEQSARQPRHRRERKRPADEVAQQTGDEQAVLAQTIATEGNPGVNVSAGAINGAESSADADAFANSIAETLAYGESESGPDDGTRDGKRRRRRRRGRGAKDAADADSSLGLFDQADEVSAPSVDAEQSVSAQTNTEGAQAIAVIHSEPAAVNIAASESAPTSTEAVLPTVAIQAVEAAQVIEPTQKISLPVAEKDAGSTQRWLICNHPCVLRVFAHHQQPSLPSRWFKWKRVAQLNNRCE